MVVLVAGAGVVTTAVLAGAGVTTAVGAGVTTAAVGVG
jgi:hypothetical protein